MGISVLASETLNQNDFKLAQFSISFQLELPEKLNVLDITEHEGG